MPKLRYEDHELEAMLRDLESDACERKESLAGDAPGKLREAICAFANDLPGHARAGVAFIGVRDDGTPSRLSVSDDLLLALSDIKTDGNIVPPPTLTVEKRRLLGADVAVVTVAPSDAPPVRYKGRIHVRVGPRRGIATAQDERILNERRRDGDRTFDSRPIRSARLADLDRGRFEREYLPASVATDVLAANDRTYEQRLAALKMIASADDSTPTVAGLLTLGVRPRDFLPAAYVQFLRLSGQDLTSDIVDEAEIDGTLADLIRRTEEKLGAHNTAAVDIKSSPTEIRTPRYPPVALAQLFRNAVLHRTYEDTNAPIRVIWFSNRIEIASPGGPYGVVNESNFGKPGFVDYRNPVLAEVLKNLGFVNRFGVGIATALRELETNGNPRPTFEVQPNWVLWKVMARA